MLPFRHYAEVASLTRGSRSASGPCGAGKTGERRPGHGAVICGAGYTNHPVLDPGAAFGSSVHGGNALGNSFVSVLEFSGLKGCSDGGVSP